MDGKTLNDLIFHVEPFELACDIGKQDLSVEEHWAEYEKILDSFNPSKTTTMPGLSIKDPSNSNSLRISESSSSRYRPTTESSSKKSVAKKTADSRSVESGSLPRTAASAARKKSAEKASTGKKKIQKK